MKTVSWVAWPASSVLMSSRSVRDPVSENKSGQFLRNNTRASPLAYVCMLAYVSMHPYTHIHATACTWTHTNIYTCTHIPKFTDIITFAFKTLDCTYKQVPFKSYKWNCIVCIYEILKQIFLKLEITSEMYKFLVLDEMLITCTRQGGPADRGTSSHLCMGTRTYTHTQ